MALWTRFFGTAGSQAVGVAIGSSAVPALLPAGQLLANEAWHRYPDRPLQAIQLAMGVASGQVAREWATDEARNTGISGERFDRLVAVFDAGPGMSSAFEMWRRGLIDEPAFRRALKRDALEPEWIDALVGLRNVLLTPAELAAMRQQGYIDGARQHDEAGKQGITAERADLQFEAAGLPPGYGELREMLHRGIITEAEFRQAIREANTKVKYTDELLQLAAPLLNPSTIVALHLKGWIDDGDFHARMAKWGYSAAEADDWHNSAGRPATVLQMVKGFRRGGRIPGVDATERAHVRKAVVQSDIRPEDFDVLFAGRESTPSAFVLRRLVQDGAFTQQEAADILYQNAWKREWADAAAASFAGGAATTSKGLTATDLANEYEARWITRSQYVNGLKQLGFTDATANNKADAEDAKRTRKARDATIALIGAQYTHHRIGRDRALAELDAAGAPARVRDGVMVEWDRQRALTPDAMTVVQIKKAWKRAVFTTDEAIARLEFKGYDAGDASEYLQQ